MNRRTTKNIVILAALIGLAACGKVGDLEPKTAQSRIPVAYGSSKPPTASELTTAGPQARPGRSDELLRRSERREDDPFDLPPGKTPPPLEPVSDDESDPEAE